MTPGYLDGPHRKATRSHAPTIAGEKHEKPHHETKRRNNHETNFDRRRTCRRAAVQRTPRRCRLLSAGFRLEGWDMNTGRRRVVRRSSRPFLLLLSPRCRAVFAVCRRGQILHLTAYRPIGNGELGSMPPYYPPLAPFFPGFVRLRPL